MSRQLFSSQAGHIALPDRHLVLVDRRTGGNLVVTPPRAVWERGELTPVELTLWAFLVAATGRAMLELLPQLSEGCINYWEAGNWALHHEAEPRGPKTARVHRRVHVHLLGRSRTAADPAWNWGEAPRFPAFIERHSWAAGNERLTAGECTAVVRRAAELLLTEYGMQPTQLATWAECSSCGYPLAPAPNQPLAVCAEC